MFAKNWLDVVAGDQMLDLMNCVAEKHSRKLLMNVVSTLLTATKDDIVTEFEGRFSLPHFQHLLDAIKRVKVFVRALGTILMIDGLNDVDAVNNFVCYKGSGVFERNVKYVFTVEEPAPEQSLTKEAAAKAQNRAESRKFWHEASRDVLKTAASTLVQAPKLELLTTKLAADDVPTRDILLAWTELPQIRAGMRRGSCKAVDARLAVLVEAKAQEMIEDSGEALEGDYASKDIDMFLQVPGVCAAKSL